MQELTTEFLKKNFKFDGKYWSKYFNDSLTMPFSFDYNNGKWHFIWSMDRKVLMVEDDPTIELKTVEDLQLYLKLIHSDKQLSLN